MIAVKKVGIILKKTHFKFENEGVLNPAAMRKGDSVHLLWSRSYSNCPAPR